MGKNTDKFIYWTPRILSIMFILFLALFSLDVISSKLTFWQILKGMLMHNIPVFILSILLWISWKREIVGGFTFILAGIFYIIQMLMNALTYNFEWYMISYSIIIAGPAFFIGALLLIGWEKRRDSKR